MQTLTILFYMAFATLASAQTWFTGNPNKDGLTIIENGYLITKTPITILDPPNIDKLNVSWDRIIGRWKVELTSKGPLDVVYKPCRFALGDWDSYTVGAGDRNGGSFLTLIPNSYEHAIEIRDALIKQLKLTTNKVSTEPISAEKHLE